MHGIPPEKVAMAVQAFGINVCQFVSAFSKAIQRSMIFENPPERDRQKMIHGGVDLNSETISVSRK